MQARCIRVQVWHSRAMNTPTLIPETIDGTEYRYVYTWGNYRVGILHKYGSAARRNRARYTGTKVHKLVAKYVVSLVDPALETRQDTFGYKFLRTGKPVLFACHPACGCTSGQHAGSPDARLTAADVTCTKCEPAA